MSNIDCLQYADCIIRVYVADELSIHQELVIGTCPVLEGDVHSARTEVTAADSDLDYCSEFLTCCIRYFSGVDFSSEVCNLSLLSCVEGSLVNAVADYSIAELTTCEVMEDEPLFPCVDHGTVVELFELSCEI